MLCVVGIGHGSRHAPHNGEARHFVLSVLKHSAIIQFFQAREPPGAVTTAVHVWPSFNIPRTVKNCAQNCENSYMLQYYMFQNPHNFSVGKYN